MQSRRGFLKLAGAVGSAALGGLFAPRAWGGRLPPPAETGSAPVSHGIPAADWGHDGTVYAPRAMCATSHPLAVEAGLEMLRKDGSAADAAVAMAACLTVVEPTSNGIGGDAFALVWSDGKLHGLNGSGRAPALLTPDAARGPGGKMPERGWIPVTVPGVPAAWRDLHARFGRLPFYDVLRPAIEYADRGHPVAPVVAYYWDRGAKILGALEGPEFAPWKATFMPGGAAPRAGDMVLLKDHAATLRRLGASECVTFYNGELAGEIDAFSRATGGLLRRSDLEAHKSEWVEPISARYRDATLWEIPPNGQGIVALSTLRILEGLPAATTWDDEADVHRALEAVKLAFADAQAHVTDPDAMRVKARQLLDDSYLRGRRELIHERAERRATGIPLREGTVYLCAADSRGMMVSYIQSNYMGFGSGVVVPGTGIALHNRGLGFSSLPGHPGAVAPGRRPFHTIIPGFLTRNGQPWGPMGVMGGHMQPQGHVQVVRALVDLGLPPQSALDLPRWQWREKLTVDVETGWPEALLAGLSARGHELVPAAERSTFGRGQIILKLPGGGYAAGSDCRADGHAAGV